MADYLNSQHCREISEEELYRYIAEKKCIVEMIEGCRRGHIIAPFRLVKNIFNEDSDAINKEFFASEYKKYELSHYVTHIQHNKERHCLCYAINAAFYTPPSQDPEEPKAPK